MGVQMAWSDNLDPASATFAIASSNNIRLRTLAGPGTGKSFAMKRRIARLLEEGINPALILAVTFTRVAAEDLHRELVGMGVPGCDNLSGVTLHSIAMRILMRNHVLQATGRIARPLSIFEMEPVMYDLMRPGRGKKRVKALVSAYEAAWARLQNHEPGFALAPEDAAFQADLLSWLRFHQAMLIGEVIPLAYDYLHSNPHARERREFTHILVDEFQDLNKAEQGVVEFLAEAAEVCIVGDDDQSIYSFKHAHPAGILEWLDANQGAENQTLDDCRRCPVRIVEIANSLIQRNTRPVPRMLRPIAANGNGDIRIIQYQSLDHEIAGVARLVSGMIRAGVPAGDILVLTQSKIVGTPIFDALKAIAVPSKSYFAESELASDEARRAFALLKLLVNRDDRVALRWLVGRLSDTWYAAGYRRIRDYCSAQGLSPWDVFLRLESGILNLPYTESIVASFVDVRTALEALEALPNLEAVIDELFPAGQQQTLEVRTLALEILPNVDPNDRETFVRQLSTIITQPEIPSEINEVRIMSLHKSKGLSAPITIIAGCNQGILPRPPKEGLTPIEQAEYLEEQRRMFYVGITRVKAVPTEGKPGTLILTYSRQMPLRDALSERIVPASQQYGSAVLHGSQFLRELGPSAPRPVAG